MRKQYRVVFYDNESLTKSRFVVIKPIKLVLLFGLFTFLVIAITFSLVFFTPFIREQIPGYKKQQLVDDYEKLQQTALLLEKRVEEQDSLLASFSRIAGLSPEERDQALGWTPTKEPTDNPSFLQPGPDPVDSVPENRERPVESPVSLAPYGKGQPESAVVPLFNPVDGIVTLEYDPKDNHLGIDVVADENSMIRSVADGVVIFSEYSTTTGWVIGIAHSQHDLISFYKHNSRLFKKLGSSVFAGEAVAVIGNTGTHTSGTHLHFELWRQGIPVNPLDYIIFN